MEEEYREFDAFVSKSGKSLIVTIPKVVCHVLDIDENDVVQIKLRKEDIKALIRQKK